MARKKLDPEALKKLSRVAHLFNGARKHLLRARVILGSATAVIRKLPRSATTMHNEIVTAYLKAVDADWAAAAILKKLPKAPEDPKEGQA